MYGGILIDIMAFCELFPVQGTSAYRIERDHATHSIYSGSASEAFSMISHLWNPSAIKDAKYLSLNFTVALNGAPSNSIAFLC